MESKIGKIKIVLVILWLIILTWNKGLGVGLSWWVWGLMLVLWWFYMRYKKIGFIALVILFFLNLYINKLFSIEHWQLNFDTERINLTYTGYQNIIQGYWKENLLIPYRLRTIFYSGWMTIFLWIDSTFKILSPLFWLRILGFSGLVVFIMGLKEKFDRKYVWWFFTVVISSGLGILLDTKMEVILALPVVVVIMTKGIKRKYWWVLVGLMVIDLILK